MIRAAIVGLGRWGRALVEAADGYDRLRFVRAVEPAMEGARAFCEQRQIVLTDDFASILADPAIDAVFLATPHSQHRSQVIACAQAGKQIFCEKPFALNRVDARAMFAACGTAGVTLAIGHNRRFWPSIQALHAMVANGELGQVLHVEGHNSNENSKTVLSGWRLSPEELPAGGLTGSGLHVLDAFVSLVGPVRNVYGHLSSRLPEPPQLDTVSLILDFQSGVSGTLATIRMTPYYWRLHVFGVEGSAEVLDEDILVLRKSRKPPDTRNFPRRDSLRDEIDAFLDAVEGKRPYPVSEAEVIATLGAFEAILRSLKEGTAVACDES